MDASVAGAAVGGCLGLGELLARIERLRRMLEAEGLFGPERKRAIPELPRVIGVVTSAQGAVLQDIRATILRRFPSRILLWPVAVQGTDAPEQIAAAIEGFGALPAGFPRPDVVIVARGGAANGNGGDIIYHGVSPDRDSSPPSGNIDNPGDGSGLPGDFGAE